MSRTPRTLRTIDSLRTIGSLPPPRSRNRRKHSALKAFALRAILLLGLAAALAGYSLSKLI